MYYLWIIKTVSEYLENVDYHGWSTNCPPMTRMRVSRTALERASGGEALAPIWYRKAVAFSA
jgi:hypothetical protein